MTDLQSTQDYDRYRKMFGRHLADNVGLAICLKHGLASNEMCNAESESPCKKEQSCSAAYQTQSHVRQHGAQAVAHTTGVRVRQGLRSISSAAVVVAVFRIMDHRGRHRATY